MFFFIFTELFFKLQDFFTFSNSSHQEKPYKIFIKRLKNPTKDEKKSKTKAAKKSKRRRRKAQTEPNLLESKKKGKETHGIENQ